jgi:hypothetical protein
MMGKGDGGKKVSINRPKKAKMGGRGTGRGSVIKLDSHGPRGYSNL